LHYVGQAEAGAYLAFKMIELPFKSISFAILNFGARIIDWGSRKKILKLILIVFLIFSTIIILFFSLESSLYNIILYFLGISYSPYLWIISYVIFNAALSNIVQLSLNSIIYDGKIREFYNIQMIIALLKIFLLVISYYFYQFKGILASLIICNLIALLFLVFFHCRSASRFQFDTSH